MPSKTMTWRDLSNRAANALETIKSAMGIGRGTKTVSDWTKFDVANLIAIKPQTHGDPFRHSGSHWYFGNNQYQYVDDKTFRALLNAGLYETPTHAANSQFAIMSEWGFELLTTGKTTALKQRTPGASKTFARYDALFPWPKPTLIEMLKKNLLSRIEKEEEPEESMGFRR